MKRDREEELRAELQFHLEEEAAERRAQGLAAGDAERAARRELGNLTLVQEETRAAWTWRFAEQLAQDVRYGLRTIAANKTFSAMAILSLALGIGANAAIFSFMDAILLRSLPVRDPQSLVILSWRTPKPEFHGSDRHDDDYKISGGGYVGGAFSYPAFELLRQNRAVFASVFGYQSAGNLNLTYRGHADLARTEYVSGNYFEGLGAQQAAGRLIGADDDGAAAAPVAVISFGLSQRRFGGAENAVGQSILINNAPFTVIGVVPREFFGADPDMHPEIYVPLHASVVLEPRYYEAKTFSDAEYDWVIPMARLRAGVSAAQAQAAAAGPFEEWDREALPAMRAKNPLTLQVREGSGGLDGLKRQYSKPLNILLALVGLILCIACANIANLLLARAAARKREIALRLSLGGGRLRIIRQLLTESVLLAALGGALGVAFAVRGMRFLTLLLANGEENFTLRAELNWHVLGVAAALALVTGVLFGLAPALQSTRMDVMPALKESRTGEARVRGIRGLSLSRVLVVGQIAVTLLILVAAGLFLRTLSNLAAIPLGFNQENVLTFYLDARQAGHKDPEIFSYYSDLRRQFSAIPGVRAASLSNHVLIGTGTSGTGVSIDGAKPVGSRVLTVGADFFNTMQIPLRMGRGIGERDRLGSPAIAVVNEEFVRANLDGGNPLGQTPLGRRVRLMHGCEQCDIEIVGVAANTLFGDLKGTPPPTMFLPFAQNLWPVEQMVYELRTEGNPLRYVAAVRELVRRADDRVPLSQVKTQSAWIDEEMNQEIVFARLCTAFAGLALAIACVGLYGTMSYKVARRTGEIGIRMALGAPRGRVMWMVMGEVTLLAIAGLAISVPVARWASKVVESFLFGMKADDAWTLAGAAGALAAAALVAGYLPARNASRIDPMVAVRHE